MPKTDQPVGLPHGQSSSEFDFSICSEHNSSHTNFFFKKMNFLLGIVLGVQKSSKDRTEGPCATFAVSPGDSILQNYGTFVMNKNLTLFYY